MKIVFLSNYYNHHQHPLSKTLDMLTQGNFIFVSSREMGSDRKLLGYMEDNSPEYILKSYVSFDAQKEAEASILDADVVNIGSAPEDMIKKRIRKGKLVFRYSERPLRNGNEYAKYIPRFFKWRKQNPMNKNVYLLCASGYTSWDYSKFGLFTDRAYKWGYFPETKYYADLNRLFECKKKNSILWCGRFLELKHPEDAINAVEQLKKRGYSFELNFIGMGSLEPQMKELVNQKGLSSYINFLGSMSPEQVRLHMEQSGIFLFTSDRREGWGAVLNEAMNSGCAVVASHEVGSVPFLIQNEINGLVYKTSNIDMIVERLCYLLDNPQEQKRLGKAAYETIINEWNAEVASKRLMEISSMILNGHKNPQPFESGPCSKADRIKENWFGC